MARLFVVVEDAAHFLAGAEIGHALRRDLDLLASAGIASRSRFALTRGKGAEPTQFDAPAFGQALAQAGGVLAIESLGLAGSGKLVYFMGIDGVKFRKPVEPGHLLDLHVTILQAKRNICKFEGRAMLGDQLATECQFTAMIADPPND